MKKADKSKIKVDRGKVDSKKDFIVDDSDLPSMTAVVDGIDQIDTAIEGGQKVVEVDPRPLPPQGQPTGGAPATRRETTSRPAIDGSGEVVQRHPVQERSGKRERASNWQRIDLNGLASESESLPQAVRPRTEYPSAEELKVQPSVTSPAPDANVQRTGGESDKKKPEMDRTRSPDINRYRLKLDL